MKLKIRGPLLLLGIGIPLIAVLLMVSQMTNSARADGRGYSVTVSNGTITETLEHLDDVTVQPYQVGEFQKFDVQISAPVTVTNFVLRITKQPWMNILYRGNLTCETLPDAWRCFGTLPANQVQNLTLQYRPEQAPTCHEWSIQTAPTSTGNDAAYDRATVRNRDCRVWLSVMFK